MMVDRHAFNQRARPALIGAALLTCVGVSAHAALASRDQRTPVDALPPPPSGFEADDHFPGALYFYLAAEDASPAMGVTGTTSLPTDVGHISRNDPFAAILPARPFRDTGSPRDRVRALQCLTSAIYYEAANEPDAGQRAVAQVVLNRVAHPAFPNTICGVVYQGSEKRGCQFSFACDGSIARIPSRKPWDQARRTALAALGGYVFAPVGLATHYHTYAVTPRWSRSLVMTGVFGAHFFHRWKGRWGTPAAFSHAYAGGEPVPGPNVRTVREPLMAAAVSPTIPDAIASDRASAQPAADPGKDRLPRSPVLEKWKDAGKPLR